MALDASQLRLWPIESVAQRYTSRDVMFYALSLGVDTLQYTYEKALAVLPAFVTVLADPGPWLGDERLGLDWSRMLHGAQRIELHRPLATSAHVRSESRIVALDDLGRERGARVITRRELFDADDSVKIATLDMTSILRGDGGFSDRAAESNASALALQEAEHTHHFEFTVPKQAALLFRLHGDMNALHADADAAREAGFDRPILHGMASFGMATYMLLRALGRMPHEMLELEARFSAPVFPGDTLRIEAGVSSDRTRAAFDVFAAQRRVKVMSRGVARFG